MVRVGLPLPEASIAQPLGPQDVAHPDCGLHVSVGLTHVCRLLPTHMPALHTSTRVQTLASVHAVPFGASTISGHRPLTHLSDSRIWQGPAGMAHCSLWHSRGPGLAASAVGSQ